MQVLQQQQDFNVPQEDRTTDDAVDATAKSAAAKAAAKAAAEEERVKREVKEAMARPPSRWREWPSGTRRSRRRSGGAGAKAEEGGRGGGAEAKEGGRPADGACPRRRSSVPSGSSGGGSSVRAPVRGRQLAPPMAPPSGACAARKGDRRASGDCERAPHPPIHSARIARSRASRFGRSHLRSYGVDGDSRDTRYCVSVVY